MARFFFAAYLAFWIGLVVGAYWLVSFVWPDPTTATCAGQGMGPYDRCSGLDYGGQLVKNQSDHHVWIAIIALVVVAGIWLLVRNWQKAADGAMPLNK